MSLRKDQCMTTFDSKGEMIWMHFLNHVPTKEDADKWHQEIVEMVVASPKNFPNPYKDGFYIKDTWRNEILGQYAPVV